MSDLESGLDRGIKAERQIRLELGGKNEFNGDRITDFIESYRQKGISVIYLGHHNGYFIMRKEDLGFIINLR